MSYLTKSKLELFALAKLKKLNLPFTHEKVVFTLAKKDVSDVDLFFFDDEDKSFRQTTQKKHAVRITPDFIVYGANTQYIIETKGRENRDFKVKWKLLRMHLASRKNKKYIMFLPKTQSNVNEVIEYIIRNENITYLS